MAYATAQALNDAIVAVMNAKTGRTDTDVAVAFPYYQAAFLADSEAYTDANVSTEITNRNTAIAAAIETEVTNRNIALNNNIAAEVTNRNAAIAEAIVTEVTNRNNAIAAAITTEVSDRNDAITAAANTEVTARNNAIATGVAAAATEADTAIAIAIATEVTDRDAAIEAAAFTAEAAGGVATARSASELNAFKTTVNTMSEAIALIPNVSVTRVNQRITHVIFVAGSLNVDVTGATLTNNYEQLTEQTTLDALNALKSAALQYDNALPPDNQINVDYAM